MNTIIAYPIMVSNKSVASVLFLYRLVLMALIRGVLRRRLFLVKLGSIKFRKKFLRLLKKGHSSMVE